MNKLALLIMVIAPGISVLAQNESPSQLTDRDTVLTSSSLQEESETEMKENHANDMTLDDKGNLYITDSKAHVIYKIDAKGVHTVFMDYSAFGVAGVGLNGITYHPDGYLLVSHNVNRDLWKVPVDNPTRVSKVIIHDFFPGANGLHLDENNNLILIHHYKRKGDTEFHLTSVDHWKSARVIARTQIVDQLSAKK